MIPDKETVSMLPTTNWEDKETVSMQPTTNWEDKENSKHAAYY